MATTLRIGGHGSVADLCGWADVRVVEQRVVRGRQADIIPVVADGRACIVKRVTPGHVGGQAEGAAREAFIRSAQREVDFYRSLKDVGAGDGELARLFPAWSLAIADAPAHEFVLVLEDLVPAGFTQTPGLSTSRMRDVLDALACFHATFWGDPASLAMERGSFWPLYKRQDGEIDTDRVAAHWTDVRSHFPHLDLDASVGPRLAAAARDLDARVAATAVTRIHGDAKAPNMFYHATNDRAAAGTSLPARVRIIDTQWVGAGNPLSDVANMLTAGLEPEALTEFDAMFTHYESSLLARLSSAQRDEYAARVRPAWDVCWLDYCRVAVLKLWGGLSPAKIEASQNVVGASMLRRSEAHVAFITERVAAKLTEHGY